MNVYLDNSATTKPSAAVAAAVGELMESGWYNPSALYKPALEIQKRIDNLVSAGEKLEKGLAAFQEESRKYS